MNEVFNHWYWGTAEPREEVDTVNVWCKVCCTHYVIQSPITKNWFHFYESPLYRTVVPQMWHKRQMRVDVTPNLIQDCWKKNAGYIINDESERKMGHGWEYGYDPDECKALIERWTNDGEH